MDIEHVPAALQERLGPPATLALVSAINAGGREWKDEVMTAAADRFERRLVEVDAGLRLRMSEMETRLLRWCFLFWIGHVAAFTAIMTALI
ncbi:MAG: hypothetical protein WD690_10185 [Vicinamibacterales bacterium]